GRNRQTLFTSIFCGLSTRERITPKVMFRAVLLLALPVILILIQPSLGVSLITVVGFIGIVLATNFNKKYLLVALAILLTALPLFWRIMAPYQRQRVLNFLEPGSDPLGAGYNSLESTIAAGAGKLTGRGLGRGIQTQLSFLPAKQTDFIFAATGEELGFLGAGLMLIATFVILWRLTVYMGSSQSPAARAYLSGFFLTYLVQVFIHTGMDMGLLPVTGLPFPLVSAGGSSLLATMMGLGIALGAYRK
ncbi:MAG TPA: FtsW/RodA/SpoVE family cell cycle protein, partial [Patescibacteria group bacterium]|nr:FtsW/RodA/SpoVE family cell cycle protein [Patescibacteria group bacterium]